MKSRSLQIVQIESLHTRRIPALCAVDKSQMQNEDAPCARLRDETWLVYYRVTSFAGSDDLLAAARRCLAVGLDDCFAGEPGHVQSEARNAQGQPGSEEHQSLFGHSQRQNCL